jgi:hypothetical protein
MPYDSTRPVDERERQACIWAAEHILEMAASDWVVQSLTRGFLPAQRLYEEALDAWLSSQSRHKTATEEAAAAALRVATTFRWWTGTVRDAQGKLQPRAISTLTGGFLPGQFVRLPRPKLAVQARGLLWRVYERPSLMGDPDRLAELAEAIEALQQAVAAEQRAAQDRLRLSKAHTRKADAFDRAWGIFVRVLQAEEDPALLAEIPVFQRADRKSADKGEVPGVNPLGEPVSSPTVDEGAVPEGAAEERPAAAARAHAPEGEPRRGVLQERRLSLDGAGGEEDTGGALSATALFLTEGTEVTPEEHGGKAGLRVKTRF